VLLAPWKELERYRQQCMTNGEVAGITGEKVDFMGLAGKMVGSSGVAASAGSGRAFLGDTMSLDGLQGLMPAVLPTASPKTKRGEGEEEDEEPSTEEKEKEKATLFDRDKAVSSAKRSAPTSTLELKQRVEKHISETKQAMAEFENPLCSGMFVNEKAVAKKGLDGLEAVLGDDESALQTYIGSFDEEMGATGKKTIGKAPPCRNYADLVPIFKIQGEIDSYDYCADKKGVETLTKEIATLKKPIVSLLAAASSGLVELRKAVEQQRDKKKAKDMKPGSCNPSPGKKLKVDERRADLFEHLGSVAQVSRVATEEAWESSKWDSLRTPLLVTSDCLKKAMPPEVVEEITGESSELATALAATKTNFLATFEKQKQPLRAMQAIENAKVEEAARTLLLTVLPYPDIVVTSKVARQRKATSPYKNLAKGVLSA
jgi:hypothetical protein